MSGTALIRPFSSIAWELRGAWAAGRRIALTLSAECDRERLEGHVFRVAPSSAFVVVAGFHVPVESILAVHHPSRLGDSDHVKGPWRGRARRVVPQLEELWAGDREAGG